MVPLSCPLHFPMLLGTHLRAFQAMAASGRCLSSADLASSFDQLMLVSLFPFTPMDMTLDTMNDKRKNTQLCYLRTPFMVACMYGSIDVIRLLLDTNKIFVDFRSSNGKPSLEFAKKSNIPDDLSNRILLAGRHWIIYNFKITPCPYRLCLERRLSCPYIHKNEAARRNPASVHYFPTLCKNFTKGHCREALTAERCNRFDTCRHAHYGEEELLRYRAAAVPAESPQPQQNAWFPMQRPAQPQDSTDVPARVPSQQETQLQDNDTVPIGVPMQLSQPPENAGVPPLQEAHLQDNDAVPAGMSQESFGIPVQPLPEIVPVALPSFSPEDLASSFDQLMLVSLFPFTPMDLTFDTMNDKRKKTQLCYLSCWNIDLSYEREGVRSTPFMVVCMYGSINVIILLLDTNKVFVDFRSSNGKTSLVFARENNIPDDLINRILLTGRHWIIYNFKITACPYHLRLESRLSCPYVHKNEAARRNPASVHYSPTLCKNFTMGYCREALNCRLAHGRTEINYHPNVFRTQRCFRGERCNQIDTCRHAHYGEEELLRYRAAAVPAKSPQPQENAWFPMQRPAQTQDNTAFLARGPPQQEPQLQGNDTVPTGVPMQLPQPPENAGVPPLQEAQLQDHDAVPLEYPKGALEFPFNLYRKLYPWPFRHFARMIWKQCSSSGTSAMSSSMRNGGNQLMITGVIHKPFFTLNIRILLEAAKSNHVKPFPIALKRDINIDESYDWEGVHRTPFMVVCMYGGENVIRLLLDTNKVFVVFKSSDGKTPLEFARESRIPDDLIKLCGRHWKIYNFKIKSCPNRSCLKGRSSCPYLHINEPARRDPAFVHYSPSLCKNFTKEVLSWRKMQQN
ncbi:hypothetical protein FXO38_25739 [Capsicum annuum]|nr:hypothetical protein FXO38_25739 [Capsicum annuum]